MKCVPSRSLPKIFQIYAVNIIIYNIKYAIHVHINVVYKDKY